MRRMIEWIKTEDPKEAFIRRRNRVNYEAEMLCFVEHLRPKLYKLDTKRNGRWFIHNLYHGLLGLEKLLVGKHEKPFYRVARRNLYFITYHWEAIHDIISRYNPDEITMDDICKVNYLEDCGFAFSKRLKQRLMIYRLSTESAYA